MRAITLLFSVTLLSQLGCSAAPHRVERLPCPPGVSRGTVFVVDGAGNYRYASEGIHESIRRRRIPLCVETVNWSHGLNRILADHLDRNHAKCEARKLAQRIIHHKKQSPDKPIYVVGYSAGTAVSLYAVEQLPPDTVECMILLAPSVATKYDLRPALRCSKNGIEVFYSERDRGLLGIGTALFGTSDGKGTVAAGRVGFRPVIGSPHDELLDRKLRQDKWDEPKSWTGNNGGHFGTYQPKFLDVYVTPYLKPAPTPPQPPKPPVQRKSVALNRCT